MKLLNLALSVIKEPMTLKRYRVSTLAVMAIFLLIFLSWEYIAPMFIKVDVKSITVCTQHFFGACVLYTDKEFNNVTNSALSILIPLIWLNALIYIFISIKRLLNIKSIYPENLIWGFIVYITILLLFSITLLFWHFNIRDLGKMSTFLLFSLFPIFISLSIRELLSNKYSETKHWWKSLFLKFGFSKRIIHSMINFKKRDLWHKNILYVGITYSILIALAFPLFDATNIIIMFMMIFSGFFGLLTFFFGTINLIRMLYFVKDKEC